jgi:hypothetical protein
MSSRCKNVWNWRILGLWIIVFDQIKKCNPGVRHNHLATILRVKSTNFKSVMKFGTREVSTLKVFVRIHRKPLETRDLYPASLSSIYFENHGP